MQEIYKSDVMFCSTAAVEETFAMWSCLIGHARQKKSMMDMEIHYGPATVRRENNGMMFMKQRD